MTKLVHRHLLEQSWREGGNLDLLVSCPRFYFFQS